MHCLFWHILLAQGFQFLNDYYIFEPLGKEGRPHSEETIQSMGASTYLSTSIKLHTDLLAQATVLLTIHWYLLN